MATYATKTITVPGSLATGHIEFELSTGTGVGLLGTVLLSRTGNTLSVQMKATKVGVRGYPQDSTHWYVNAQVRETTATFSCGGQTSNNVLLSGAYQSGAVLYSANVYTYEFNAASGDWFQNAPGNDPRLWNAVSFTVPAMGDYSVTITITGEPAGAQQPITSWGSVVTDTVGDINVYVKVGSTLHKCRRAWTKVNGQLKECAVWTKVNGTVKKIG